MGYGTSPSYTPFKHWQRYIWSVVPVSDVSVTDAVIVFIVGLVYLFSIRHVGSVDVNFFLNGERCCCNHTSIIVFRQA